MTPKLQLLAYSFLMAIIIVSAYFGLIPTRLHDIPFYDSAGHFVLYGLWGYFFGNAFRKPVFKILSLDIQTGILVALFIALVEELLQQLSPMRSFSLGDLMFGIVGIAIGCIALNIKLKN